MSADNWHAIAALLSLITFAVHTFVGGRVVARPLLADDTLPRASKWLNYFCWHIVTVLLVIMALAFAAVARGLLHPDAAALLGVMALSFSPLSASIALRGGIAPWRFPSTSLFLLIGLAALAGQI